MNFGISLNQSLLKISPKVQESIRKFGLYKFEQSAADLKGTEGNPVKIGTNEELTYEG